MSRLISGADRKKNHAISASAPTTRLLDQLVTRKPCQNFHMAWGGLYQQRYNGAAA
jgi:hypothetical protein